MKIELTEDQILYLRKLLICRKQEMGLNSIAEEQASEEYQQNADLRAMFENLLE